MLICLVSCMIYFTIKASLSYLYLMYVCPNNTKLCCVFISFIRHITIISNGFAVCRQPLLSLCIFELRKWIIAGGMGIVGCSMWIVVGGMWIGDRGW